MGSRPCSAARFQIKRRRASRYRHAFLCNECRRYERSAMANAVTRPDRVLPATRVCLPTWKRYMHRRACLLCEADLRTDLRMQLLSRVFHSCAEVGRRKLRHVIRRTASTARKRKMRSSSRQVVPSVACFSFRNKRMIPKTWVITCKTECLHWVAEGKNDFDVVSILGISRPTALKHIRSARTPELAPRGRNALRLLSQLD